MLPDDFCHLHPGSGIGVTSVCACPGRRGCPGMRVSTSTAPPMHHQHVTICTLAPCVRYYASLTGGARQTSSPGCRTHQGTRDEPRATEGAQEYIRLWDGLVHRNLVKYGERWMQDSQGDMVAVCWNCDMTVELADGFRVKPWRSPAIRDGLLICPTCYTSIYLPLSATKQIDGAVTREAWTVPRRTG
jgi:hypothetical protein